MQNSSSIDEFVSAVRERLNRHRAANALLMVITVGLAASLVPAAFYIFRGYAVPWTVYGVVAAITLIAALVAVWARRLSVQDARHFVDGYYDLSDAVSSANDFTKSGKSEGLYGMQIQGTSEVIGKLDPEKIRYRIPVGRVLLCAFVAGTVVFTAFKPPSLEVLDRLAMEEQTLRLTEEFNKQLEEEIDALEEELDNPDERELLDAKQLRKWAEELAATKDRNEAMRQMANLEKKITRMANKLRQEKNERLMEKVAKELQEEREHRNLANKLQSKKYKDAGKDINKLAPKAKELTERQKQLAKLKSAARRMSAAARNARTSSKRNQGSNQDGKGMPNPGQQELSELLESLDLDVAELEGELSELELQEMKGELTEMDLKNAQLVEGKIGEKLALIDAKLGKMDAARALRLKLQKLGKKLGQGQGWIAGRGESPFSMPGGKEPGVGTSDLTRSEKDPLEDNGQTAALQGIKGQGPSLTRVESAESGTGISNRKVEARQRNFKRQFESFVSREDVPDDVKGAVKEYFTTIHEQDEVTPEESEQPR